MAQNITLMGASYSDVPAVTLPKTGGGTASFTDVTDTTASASDVLSGKYFYTSGGVRTQGTASGGGGTPTIESLTVTPSTSQQTFNSSSVDGYKPVVVDAMPTMTLPTTASTTQDGTLKATLDRSTSDRYINIPVGYNSAKGSYKISKVSNGTEGTPTATKGTVSNHSVTVTPSVTNSAGYISGGTHNGTAVTVSASELVSGSETKTSNGTYDVTNLAELVVNVSGGGGTDKIPLLQTTTIGSISTSSTSAADTGKTISLASSTNFTDYDMLIVAIGVDTHTNNRHLCSIGFVFLTGTSNVSTKNTYAVGSNVWNTKLSSSGTQSSRQSTTKYGIYPNGASVSSGTMTITVYQRYNSNNTGTINGSYTARVYGVKLVDLVT